MLSYRSLLKQAWGISWKHKYLWILGLFASLTAAAGSWEYQMLTENLNQNVIDGSYNRLSLILTLSDTIKSFFLGLASLFSYDILTILNTLSLLLLAFILIASFVWLAVVCQAALIKDIKKIVTAKKKEPKLSVREALTVGKDHFWSVLGLNVIMKILISFAFFLVSLPLLFMIAGDSSVLAAIYVILFVLFIPLATGLSLLLKYAIAYRVLDDKSFVASIESAGKLFGENWLVSLEMAVILFIINFVASIAVLILFALFLLPLLIIGIISQTMWIVVTVLLAAITLTAVCGSLLTTFQTAAWTDLFLHLREKGGLAKLERIFQPRL